METRTRQGFLVLADVSGFTAFLTSSELEHAQDIIGELLDLIVRHLTPPFELAEVEGDAVYVYATERAAPTGDHLLRLVENTYAAFRDRADAIERRSVCRCTACRSVNLLDLKFIIHFGDYVLQEVGGKGKPLGSAVNLAHRLLKSSVSESTGWNAYVLFTQPAAARAGLNTVGMHIQKETFPSLGEVTSYSLELRSRHKARRQAQRIVVSDEESDLRFSFTMDVPPESAWEWLNNPARRSQWEAMQVVPGNLTPPRAGAGATTHCFHGDKVREIQVVTDWEPFGYFTYESSTPRGKTPDSTTSIFLAPFDGGTQVEVRMRVHMRPRWLGTALYRLIVSRIIRKNISRLQRLTRDGTD